jgi:hypothetical protein
MKYTTFFATSETCTAMVLTSQILDDILDYMDDAMKNLAKEAFENLEIEGGIKGIEDFLQNQFDVRLENLLKAKNSSIHHLESGMKNSVIQRKQKAFEKIFNQHKN